MQSVLLILTTNENVLSFHAVSPALSSLLQHTRDLTITNRGGMLLENC